MLKVKIIKGSGWYCNKVGEVFSVVGNSGYGARQDCYLLESNRNLCINMCDCVEYKVPTNKEVLEFFYKEYTKYNYKEKTYEAKRLEKIIKEM